MMFNDNQFNRFLIAGGIAAVVNFISRIFFGQWVGFSYSIVLAYLFGMLTAFLLTRAFVFKKTTRSLGSAALGFTLINILAILQTWLITVFLAQLGLPWIGVISHAEEIGHAVGIMIPVLTSYLGHKHFSFREETGG